MDRRANKPTKHGADHLPGGQDPIPFVGLQYDTDNEGDWFYAAANVGEVNRDGDGTTVVSWEFSTGSSDAPGLLSGDGGWIIDTAGDIAIKSGGNLRLTAPTIIQTVGHGLDFSIEDATFGLIVNVNDTGVEFLVPLNLAGNLIENVADPLSAQDAATKAYVDAHTGGGAVSSVFGRTGAVVAAAGDYTAAQVTNAADKASGSQQAFTAEVEAPDFAAAGLTGAIAASRYVGATASGAPITGTFSVGDWITTHDGHVFICTVAGSPGTWVDAGSGGGIAFVTANSGSWLDVTTTGLDGSGYELHIHGTAPSSGGNNGILIESDNSSIQFMTVTEPINLISGAGNFGLSDNAVSINANLGSGWGFFVNSSSGTPLLEIEDGGPYAIGLYGATPVAQPAAIAAPTGGGTVDTQARAAIVSILNALGAAAGGIGITA